MELCCLLNFRKLIFFSYLFSKDHFGGIPSSHDVSSGVVYWSSEHRWDPCVRPLKGARVKSRTKRRNTFPHGPRLPTIRWTNLIGVFSVSPEVWSDHRPRSQPYAFSVDGSSGELVAAGGTETETQVGSYCSKIPARTGCGACGHGCGHATLNWRGRGTGLPSSTMYTATSLGSAASMEVLASRGRRRSWF